MLVLSKTVVDNIREGRQTAVLKDVDHKGWNVGARHKIYHGHPANGAKKVMEVIITAVQRKRLSDLIKKDARALGFASVAEFFANWLEYKSEVDASHRVWIIHIEEKNKKRNH